MLKTESYLWMLALGYYYLSKTLLLGHPRSPDHWSWRQSLSDSRTSAFHVRDVSFWVIYLWMLYFPCCLQPPQAEVFWEIAFISLWGWSLPLGRRSQKSFIRQDMPASFSPSTSRLRAPEKQLFPSSRHCTLGMCFFLHSTKLCVFVTVRDRGLQRSNLLWPLHAGPALRMPSVAHGKWEKNWAEFISLTKERHFSTWPSFSLDFPPQPAHGRCLGVSILWQARWMHAMPKIRLSVQFSHSVVSDSLRLHGLQHARLPCDGQGSLLKLMSIESVMPSNHLILCCPLLLQPSIFHSIMVFSNLKLTF